MLHSHFEVELPQLANLLFYQGKVVVNEIFRKVKMPREPPYKVGENVMARWPGSSMYYAAKVINTEKSGKWEVLFADGTTHAVQKQNITFAIRGRSKSRSPGRQPKKSPTRSSKTTPKKKPSPSRSRSRSPGTIIKRVETKKAASPSKANAVGKSPPTPPEPKSPSIKKRSRATVKTPSEVAEKTPPRVSEKTVIRVTEKTPTRVSEKVLTRVTTKSATRSSARLATFESMKAAEKVTEVEHGWSSDDGMEVDSAKHYADQPSSRVHTICTALGISLLMILAPVFVLVVNLACDRFNCTIMKLPKFPRTVSEYFDVKILGLYVGWVLLQALLAMILPGKLAEGQPTTKGERLVYRLNGIGAFLITMTILFSLWYFKMRFDLIFDKFIQLIVASIVVSYIISVMLYLVSLRALRSQLSPCGKTGNLIVDFYMGRELNPRILNLDLKTFISLRTGLIGWAVLNVLMIINELQIKHDKIYFSLLFVTVTQILYVMDMLWFEESFLTTFDVTNEGLGFLMVFRNMCVVPFVFTLAPRFLMIYRPSIPYWALGFVMALFFVGYTIYRCSNLQKDEFRRDPYSNKFKDVKTVSTSSPKTILASSWWAGVRHPNYVGDLIIALAWSLPCGFEHIIPYTYVVYLLILLIHRTRRVERSCQVKHGIGWDCYRQQVRYRLIPGIF